MGMLCVWAGLEFRVRSEPHGDAVGFHGGSS
jgi:hypothetical protein